MILLLLDLFGGKRLRVTITIPVDVQTFGRISQVASAMGRIESEMKKAGAPIADFRSPRAYNLIHFRINSPPEASILADPAWLGVFIATIALGVSVLQLAASYPQLKTGIKEVGKDLSLVRKGAVAEMALIIDEIDGLTKQNLEKLRAGAALYIEDILSRAEATSQDALSTAARIATTLGARDGRRPRIYATTVSD